MSKKGIDFSNEKFGFNYIEVRKNEVTPERIKELDDKLDKIELRADRLSFLDAEMQKYLDCLSAESYAVSGNTGASNPIFFDQIIQNRIDRIEKEQKKIFSQAQDDVIPSYEYKTEAQKIAWLHEIGILDIVINKCKDGETVNSRRAANVIHSFTGIDAGTLRKCLGAIYQPGTDQKNNPLVNTKNKLFVAEMAAKFKLNKENKNK